MVLSLCPAGAEEFLYKHEVGNKYRILSTVNEDVYIDHMPSHRAEILNRIAVEIIAESDGKGTHRAVFQTSERAVSTGARSLGTPASFQWAKEYESEFDRDPLGRMTIDRKYFMPVVRDVPVFPGKDLKQGEQWSYEGHEVHDFRDNFGIQDPYLIPFTANYVYLGPREWKGRSYPAFSVSYQINIEPSAVRARIWPKRISGASNQTVFWDSEMGQFAAYTEEFSYRFELSNGRTIEYRGKAEAEIVESQLMDKRQIAEEIAGELRRLDITGVSVRVVDEGITLSLDNIQFQADTAIMLPGEREKLNKIVDILKRYQERDILVGGHTALAGTADGRMKLSSERASVVAGYLIEQGARTPDRVVVRGYGAERPIADNRTEEGMRRNRRVEITILEN
ncbi:MAG: OmpA family protein [Treponema sp.]|nr:OmpA family protein [Treponema sp.]